jgi:hypothetical protein
MILLFSCKLFNFLLVSVLFWRNLGRTGKTIIFIFAPLLLVVFVNNLWYIHIYTHRLHLHTRLNVYFNFSFFPLKFIFFVFSITQTYDLMLLDFCMLVASGLNRKHSVFHSLIINFIQKETSIRRWKHNDGFKVMKVVLHILSYVSLYI